jgi:DNA-nicking Smr family endonuclease
MPKRPRALRPEEQALWDRVADTARALHPRRKAPLPKLPELPVQRDPAPPIPAFRIGEAVRAPASGHVLQPGLAERLAGEPVRMDRKAFDRLKRGKLRPEGKLDLHGLTLAEAHPELIRFILSAHAAGKRLVLVVTGKGRDRDDGGPIPAPRGALRHQVPVWLGQPPVAAHVLQVTGAHIRHGGAGAYYVYLRRQPGKG